MTDVILRDFQPINRWELDHDGPTWSSGQAKYLIDMTTGRRYWNESKGCVRLKCFLLTLGTPFVHSIPSLENVVFRIIKLISLSHFRKMDEEEESYSFKARLKDAGQDVLSIFTTIIAFVGLELAALYGILTPYNGRKIYASIERAQYERLLAPCFQPDPKYHALGGDPKVRNAF